MLTVSIKGRSSKFREGSRVRLTPGEGRKAYWPKRCGNNNKDEGNSPKTLNDKNTYIKYLNQLQLVRLVQLPVVWYKI